jgi:hypothetical protein
MTYADKVRIAIEVSGAKPAPESEPADCAEWRRSLEADRAKMAAVGIGFDLPCDWD